jgi:hypothetical protein
MPTKVLIFLIFIIICVIIGMIIYYKEKFISTDSTDPSINFTPNGICVFDIDGTITCGLDRAAKAISRCKELGFKIAINTARPTKWYDDLDLNSLGLHKNDFDSDFYHGKQLECSFIDTKSFEESIASTKVTHLRTLSEKWNVNPRRIILFDDQYPNIEKAKQAGFSAIFANHNRCGLPDNVVELINNLI